MIEVYEKAVIDADFFNKVTNDGSDTSLFSAVMEEMSFQPVMHKYVYEYELAGNTAAHTLVKDGYIKIEDESLFLATNSNSYNRAFLMFYRQMNGCVFPTRADVYTYHHSKENLGEIRSSLLAFFMGYHYFMSDDRGAKHYITNSFSGRHAITVMNLYDTFERIGGNKERSIKWKDVKGVLKQRLENKDYEKLREIWVSQ